jgi:hypothetical protein
MTSWSNVWSLTAIGFGILYSAPASLDWQTGDGFRH